MKKSLFRRVFPYGIPSISEILIRPDNLMPIAFFLGIASAHVSGWIGYPLMALSGAMFGYGKYSIKNHVKNMEIDQFINSL